MSPQYRWPNEGLVSSSHNKKPAYDELNMAQWTSGQLNNMLLVEDNTTLRCMLTQMALAMRNAGSLPWPAVRSSWAVSMTDVEEGRLQWCLIPPVLIPVVRSLRFADFTMKVTVTTNPTMEFTSIFVIHAINKDAH